MSDTTQELMRTLEDELMNSDNILPTTQNMKEYVAKKQFSLYKNQNPEDYDLTSIKGATAWQMMNDATIKSLEAIEKTVKQRIESKVKLSEVRQNDQSNELIVQFLKELKEGKGSSVIPTQSLETDTKEVDEIFKQDKLPPIPETELRTNPDDLS